MNWGFSWEKDRQIFYIVDYDLPSKPVARRRAFYRNLAKLKLRRGLYGILSSQSVIVTSDFHMAREIYYLALRHGAHTNFYIAQKLDDHIPYALNSYHYIYP